MYTRKVRQSALNPLTSRRFLMTYLRRDGDPLSRNSLHQRDYPRDFKVLSLIGDKNTTRYFLSESLSRPYLQSRQRFAIKTLQSINLAAFFFPPHKFFPDRWSILNVSFVMNYTFRRDRLIPRRHNWLWIPRILIDGSSFLRRGCPLTRRRAARRSAWHERRNSIRRRIFANRKGPRTTGRKIYAIELRWNHRVVNALALIDALAATSDV